MTTYTLFGQPSAGMPSPSTDNGPYTLGVEFEVSTSATLNGLWWWSGPGATALPNWIGLSTTTGSSWPAFSVSQSSPSWSGAAGSGWVFAAFTSPPAVVSGTKYLACISTPGGATFFYSSTPAYWNSGAGGGGITNGPLSAPNNAGSVLGIQDSFAVTAQTVPTGGFNNSNYWIDPQITTGATNVGVSDSMAIVETVSVNTANPVSTSDLLAIVESVSVSVSVHVTDFLAALDGVLVSTDVGLTKVTVIALTSRVQENSSFSSSVRAGAPYQGNMRQLAFDRWNYMYPS